MASRLVLLPFLFLVRFVVFTIPLRVLLSVRSLVFSILSALLLPPFLLLFRSPASKFFRLCHGYVWLVVARCCEGLGSVLPARLTLAHETPARRTPAGVWGGKETPDCGLVRSNPCLSCEATLVTDKDLAAYPHCEGSAWTPFLHQYRCIRWNRSLFPCCVHEAKGNGYVKRHWEADTLQRFYIPNLGYCGCLWLSGCFRGNVWGTIAFRFFGFCYVFLHL